MNKDFVITFILKSLVQKRSDVSKFGIFSSQVACIIHVGRGGGPVRVMPRHYQNQTKGN